MVDDISSPTEVRRKSCGDVRYFQMALPWGRFWLDGWRARVDAAERCYRRMLDQAEFGAGSSVLDVGNPRATARNSCRMRPMKWSRL